MSISSDVTWPSAPQAHAFDDELARLDAVATVEAIDARELSVREVTEATIRRARSVEPQIGAIAFERFDQVLAEPEPPRTRRGSLEGLPTFMKNQVAVAGLPLTWGSVALEGGEPAKRSKGVAIDFEKMGMVPLGLSKMPEFGFTPSTEFPDAEPTRNPWNLERTIGGSSGGAAALVAAGVVPIAHAVDGGGSIRIPAACGGLVGLKPTRGRLRKHVDEERLPIAVSVDGVVTRSVRDTALFYAEMERVRGSGKLPPIGLVTGPPERRLRIAAFAEPDFSAPLDEPTRATFEQTAELLGELGHEVEIVGSPLTVRDRDDFISYFQLLAFLATKTARITHGKHVTPEDFTIYTRGMVENFRSAPSRLIGASRRLRGARRRMADFMRGYDLVLSPTVTTLPPQLGRLSPAVPASQLLDRLGAWMALTPVANITGAPSITLPLGFDVATNLPVGAMLGASQGEEGLLLRVALELEEARPWPGAAGVA